ncbi:unnamed protein product [Brachionus calyciflorus]|uniref:Uncharacterized protein n=1 Tax=Brachionus calyciflorus TaxID=104777 RepID=A0A814KXW7_9BILA|nr:unnamed protein product [Brachionus calyciflorus]
MEIDENTNDNSSKKSTKKSLTPPKDQSNQKALIDLINKTFVNNLKILTKKYDLTDTCLLKKKSKFSFWFLNDLLVPLDNLNNNSCDLNGLITLRYIECENYGKFFKDVNLEIDQTNFDFDAQNEHSSFDLLNQINLNKNTSLKVSFPHVHNLYAFEHTGKISCPLVVLPNKEPLDPGSTNSPIKKTVCLARSQNGDFNSITFFIEWLDMFIKQNNDLSPKFILADKFLFVKLKTLLDQENFDLIKTKLIENEIYFLFYPFEHKISEFLIGNFDTQWTKNLIEYGQRENPNNEDAYLFLFKQTLRQITHEFKNDVFNFLIDENSLEFKKLSDVVVPVESTTQQVVQEPEVQEPESNKLSDVEVDEYINWIDEMSKMNSLCIKYTFLRDFGQRNKTENQNKKEILSNEKRWNDLLSKSRGKFKYENSLGILSENEYLTKSLDASNWRKKYLSRLNELQIDKPEQIWHFEIFQFPYMLNSSMLKNPEKDTERPKNSKSRVSVLFAFNASGDYLQPYFVYPTNFSDEENTELGSNECFSQNGYVTPKIFTNWLMNFYVPYIESTNKVILLYCAKLAIIDKNLIMSLNNNEVLKNRINFFGICSENLKPFNFLFTKNLRNRPIDLFLDSWRKVTTKLKLSHQFKCKSRQQFFNLFMDTFQNCIEEIGNGDGLNKSLNTSSVSLFKDKMISTFEQCKLWPLNNIEQQNETIEDIVERTPKRKRIDSSAKKTPVLENDKQKSGNLEQSIKSLIKNQINVFADSSVLSNKKAEDSSNSHGLIRDLIILLIEKKSNRETNENGCDSSESLENLEKRLEALSKTCADRLEMLRKLFDELNVRNESNENGIADKLTSALNNFYQFR